MPYTEVMKKWKEGKLHSGSPKGPEVKSQKQAVAIMLSEKRAAAKGKEEYMPKGKTKFNKGGSVGPSTKSIAAQNLAETAANPTGPSGLKKGGPVGVQSGGRRPGASGKHQQ